MAENYIGKDVINPSCTSKVDSKNVYPDKLCIKAIGKDMSENAAISKALQNINKQIASIPSVAFVRITTEKIASLTDGEYAGGFRAELRGRFYKVKENNGNNTETAKDSSLTQKLSSSAEKLVDNIVNSTSLKNASKKAEEKINELLQNKQLQELLSQKTTEQNLKSIEKLIDQTIDSKLKEELTKIDSQYGNAGSLEYVNKKLDVIRSYKYAFVANQKIKDELVSKNLESINKTIQDNIEKLKLNGEEYIKDILSQKYPDLLDGIVNTKNVTDTVTNTVTKKMDDFVNTISTLDEAKLSNMLSNQIYTAVSKSDEIKNSIEELDNKLSGLGVKLPVAKSIADNIKTISDSIGKESAKQIIPYIEKKKEKIQLLTKTITEVKNAIVKAKKDAMEYINRLKTIANDFIARETAILSQEISKYIKINVGDLAGSLKL